MNNKTLFLIWGGLFILCALLGFIPPVSGFASVLLTLVSAAFFVPLWILFYRGKQQKDLGLLAALRGISIASLAATLIFLILFFMTAGTNEAGGIFLYGLLVVFSSPMVCSQFWIGSLFVWACLFFASFSAIRKAKKQLS